MNERYVIPSLDRAFRVLDLIGCTPRGLTLAELQRQSGIPKSTLFRIMVTLQKRHCVVWDEENRSYRLGSTLWKLGSSFLDQSDLYHVASRYMKNLADKTCETIFLGKIEEGQVVYLRRMASPKSVTVVKKLGQRVPVHCTATGMVMLAFMPRAEAEAIIDAHDLAAYNASTVTDRKALLNRLDEIFEQGYAVVDGEYNKELLCISAPVLDHSRRPRASLTVAMLSQQASNPQTIAALAGHVKDTALAFSKELGYEVDAVAM